MRCSPTLLSTSLLLWTLTACAPTDDAPRDVLFITVDTLRADMVGVNGHPRPSTPNLDRIGEAGVVFERHYSTVPMTAPSHATMFTGLWVAEHGLLRNGNTFPAEVPTLAETYREAGYRTAAVIGSMVLDKKFGMDRGFDVFDQSIELRDGLRRRRKTSAERYASEVVDVALSILDDTPQDQPLFLWVHVFDPHAPFEAPERHIEAAGSKVHFRPRLENTRLFLREELLGAYLGYELEIAYTDHELGRLLEAWDTRERGPNSVVAITSDHGEGMGEHGLMEHALFLYEEQLHVPLVIRAPGRIEPGSRVETPTSMIDLAATLVELATPGADSPLPGADLTGALRGEAVRTVAAERPYFSDFDLELAPRAQALTLYEDRGNARGAQVTLIDSDWKFIKSADVQPEIYDLVEDPSELENLYREQSERLAEFESRLGQWSQGLAPTAASESLEDEDTLRMLEALGYR